MTSLLQTGYGMISAYAGRGRPGGAEKRFLINSTVLTTNKTYKHWPEIFNNDAALTSAVLDRVLHHAETIIIDGSSYRMKDRVSDV